MNISVCTIHIAYVLAIMVYVMLGNNIKIAQFRNWRTLTKGEKNNS